MAESKSSLQKVLEEMLARTRAQQSPQAQVNAQMSAKDPNFAAGALVGQLLASYIGRQLRNRQKEQSVNDADQAGGGTNPAQPSAAGLAAGQQALPVDTNALQQQFLGNLNDNSALSQAANNQFVNAPFENLSEEERRRLMYGR